MIFLIKSDVDVSFKIQDVVQHMFSLGESQAPPAAPGWILIAYLNSSWMSKGLQICKGNYSYGTLLVALLQKTIEKNTSLHLFITKLSKHLIFVPQINHVFHGQTTNMFSDCCKKSWPKGLSTGLLAKDVHKNQFTKASSQKWPFNPGF